MRKVPARLALILASLALSALLAGGTCAGAGGEPVPRTAIKVIAESGAKEWTLLVLGDSFLDGFPAAYAAVLKDELKIPVVVRSYLIESAAGMLQALRGDEQLRRDLGGADVVFFTVPRRWFGAFAPDLSGAGEDAAARLQASLPGALQAYQAEVDEIIAELVALRSPFEAIIRTMDLYAPWDIGAARSAALQPLLHQYWSTANEYLIEAASAARIPAARVHATFSGVAGNEDPLAKGYLEPGGMRCTESGVRQLVRLVDELELGYGLYKID